jgi:hypothetical protein
MAVDLTSEAVKRIMTRHGVRAQGLYELFILEAEATMTLSQFGAAMKRLAEDAETPFGPKVKTMHGLFYPLKACATSEG